MSRNDPIQNFRFRVEIDGITQAGFSEVIMPDATIDVIEYREGSEQTHVRKLSGLTKFSNIILKWGITDSMDLYDWVKSVMDSGASGNRKNMSIVLIDEEGNDRMRWNFMEAWPVRYKISDLNAMTNQVVFEIIEITFERFSKES
ncbi:MAG: phage tail protein [Ignavibacteria bacterium]|nr:phage tail protein [Ignavibacteria bacterium]